MKPRLLDLFCGAGGAAVGYARAGFDVVGVDFRPQPNYPFEFHKADAFTYPMRGFDVVHASPPCQAYSSAARLRNGTSCRPRLIEAVREKLKKRPYVIENVPGAPLIEPVTLCGSSFNLQVRRHRLFESNLPLWGRRCAHHLQSTVVGVYGDHPQKTLVSRKFTAMRAGNVEDANEAMNTGWMQTWGEVKEAIPPAYTEFIGRQLLECLM
jgi:DNA (cytosine-5)-methyltransferase 1